MTKHNALFLSLEFPFWLWNEAFKDENPSPDCLVYMVTGSWSPTPLTASASTSYTHPRFPFSSNFHFTILFLSGTLFGILSFPSSQFQWSFVVSKIWEVWIALWVYVCSASNWICFCWSSLKTWHELFIFFSFLWWVDT